MDLVNSVANPAGNDKLHKVYETHGGHGLCVDDSFGVRRGRLRAARTRLMGGSLRRSSGDSGDGATPPGGRRPPNQGLTGRDFCSERS